MENIMDRYNQHPHEPDDDEDDDDYPEPNMPVG
jgi:hypothetical protein